MTRHNTRKWDGGLRWTLREESSCNLGSLGEAIAEIAAIMNVSHPIAINRYLETDGTQLNLVINLLSSNYTLNNH